MSVCLSSRSGQGSQLSGLMAQSTSWREVSPECPLEWAEIMDSGMCVMSLHHGQRGLAGVHRIGPEKGLDFLLQHTDQSFNFTQKLMVFGRTHVELNAMLIDPICQQVSSEGTFSI